MLGRVPLPKELGKPEPNNEVGSGRSVNFSRATVEVRGAPPRVRSRAGIDLPSLPPNARSERAPAPRKTLKPKNLRSGVCGVEIAERGRWVGSICCIICVTNGAQERARSACAPLELSYVVN